jgi:hypothetical protein
MRPPVDVPHPLIDQRHAPGDDLHGHLLWHDEARSGGQVNAIGPGLSCFLKDFDARGRRLGELEHFGAIPITIAPYLDSGDRAPPQHVGFAQTHQHAAHLGARLTGRGGREHEPRHRRRHGLEQQPSPVLRDELHLIENGRIIDGAPEIPGCRAIEIEVHRQLELERLFLPALPIVHAEHAWKCERDLGKKNPIRRVVGHLQDLPCGTLPRPSRRSRGSGVPGP